MVKQLTLTLMIITLHLSLNGQDTLPRFTLKNIGSGKIVISWVNPLNNINQISIQRSFDSLNHFKTILSVADPKALLNGYADAKAPNDHMFYRLFYAVQGGAFYFTEAKRAIYDSTLSNTTRLQTGTTTPADSAALKKIESFVPSFYVYTQKNGYVFINLPDAERQKYHLKFYEDDGSFIFEIKGIKETALTLDKANFYHGGWFRFELFKDDKLVEKHKFYLPKDF